MPKILIILMICFAVPATAQQTFKCELKKNSRFGWIPPELYVELNEKSMQATVFDGYIKEYVGKPITSEFSGDDSASYNFSWVVPNIKISNQPRTVNVEYDARLNKTTGRMNLTAYLLSGSDMPPPRGSGTCKPFKR